MIFSIKEIKNLFPEFTEKSTKKTLKIIKSFNIEKTSKALSFNNLREMVTVFDL